MRLLARKLLNIAKTLPSANAFDAAAGQQPSSALGQNQRMFVPGIDSLVFTLIRRTPQHVSESTVMMWNECLRWRNAAGIGGAQALPPAQLAVWPPEGGARNDE